MFPVQWAATKIHYSQIPPKLSCYSEISSLRYAFSFLLISNNLGCRHLSFGSPHLGLFPSNLFAYCGTTSSHIGYRHWDGKISCHSYSGILAYRIPRVTELCGLQSMGCKMDTTEQLTPANTHTRTLEDSLQSDGYHSQLDSFSRTLNFS